MKLVALLIGLVLLCGVSNASQLKSKGNLYIEQTKEINGGMIFAIPVLEWNLQQKPFMVDLEFRNNFTLPRGVIAIPNHLSSQLEVHLGQKWNNYFATFSLGGEVIYDGNDYGLQSGVRGFNTIRIGMEF
jgi:ABC-type amino acid transport system permease subunit